MDSKPADNLAYDQIVAGLSQKLRTLRFSSGMSQEAVAHLAGISTYTYQKFEKGESKPNTPMNPRLSTLIALADVFDVDVCELLRSDGAA